MSKKGNRLLYKPAQVIYEFMRTEQKYTVAKWVVFFGVSRSGYYSYVGRRETREEEKQAKSKEIKQIFDESEGTYGPDRICGILRKNGKKASYRKISKIMAELGLHSIHRRHKTRSLTDSRKARGVGYPNLVRNQRFEEPYQALCIDITYLKKL